MIVEPRLNIFLVIDDFLSNYKDVLAEAEHARYRTYETPVGNFPGIAVYDSPWAYERFSQELGFPIKKVFEYFRRYERGINQPTFIHPDYESELAATLSLAREREHNGWFCLWRHKETGLQRPDFTDPRQMETFFHDGKDESRWETIQKIEMIPNRCVVYSADYFHSRYPRDWEGNRPRLIQAFFFNQRRD